MATKGNAQGVGGGSQIDVNPTKSSNKALGISDYVARGTAGPRYTKADGDLGNEMTKGELREGKSVGAPSVNMNSGARERRSSGDGLYARQSYPEGTLTARANMTLGGDKSGEGRYGGNRLGLGLSTKAKQPLVKKVSKGYDQSKGTTGKKFPQGTVGKKGRPDQ